MTIEKRLTIVKKAAEEKNIKSFKTFVAQAEHMLAQYERGTKQYNQTVVTIDAFLKNLGL